MQRIPIRNIVFVFCSLQLSIVFSQNSNYKLQHMKMVDEQILPRGISDANVIKALIKVERHLFVPENLRKHAYRDGPLPIGYDQTISQPYIVAYMTEALKLDENDTVLEIGTGSGYQAAILGEICKAVYTIEIVEPLGKRATEILKELKYDNIHVKVGDGYKGWPENAPFDAIIVTCAPTKIPQPLIDQLKEGGRMAIPYGKSQAQLLEVFIKKEGKLKRVDMLPVRFVPMVDEEGDSY